jgi:molybdopterin synthase sulfur carrier subunit
MSIKVLYFASLRETLGYSHETLTLPASIATLGDLRSHLARRGGVWEALGEGRNVRAAINQEMASPDKAVADRDEIAFFPPLPEADMRVSVQEADFDVGAETEALAAGRPTWARWPASSATSAPTSSPARAQRSRPSRR